MGSLISTLPNIYLLMSQLKKLIIKESSAAEIIKAQNVPKCKIGIINPANENPLKVNWEIETFGTNIVNR